MNSNVNGVLRPVAGAFITVCAAGNANVPCAPPLAGVLFKDQALTQPLANPTTTDANGNYPTMALAAGNYTITETAVGFTGFSYQITVTCGSGGCTATNLTVTGAATLGSLTVGGSFLQNGIATFTADTTVQGKLFLSAGNTWIDVKAPPYSAKCDGATDDTTTIQNALNTLNAQVGGGTLYVPPGNSPCLVSTLSMDGFINVTVLLGGFGKSSEGGNNSQANIRFTGSCSAAACLSMRSTGDIHWWGGTLSFPNATTSTCTNSYGGVSVCPMIDLSHSGLNVDSVRIGFHYTALVGPGATSQGPIVLDQQTDIVTFDHVLFTGASVFVLGPVNNAAGFTDKTIVYASNPYLPGTCAFENASVNWTFQDNIYTSPSASVPFLCYVNSNTQQQNISFLNNEFLTGATGTISLVTMPAPPSALYGGLTWQGNLVVSTNANLTALNIGNNQRAHVSGGSYSGVGTVMNLGTGVNINVGAAQYNSIANFLVGTPAGGTVIDNTGTTTTYGAANVAAGAALNLVCGAQPTLPVTASSLWCSNSDNRLRATKGGDTGGAGSIVLRAGDNMVTAGTTPTLTGTGACATFGAKVGGAFAGSSSCASTTAASTLTITFATAAPNGYACNVQDETTRANLFQQTSHTTTTCVLTATSVTQNDVFVFTGIGF